MLSKSTLKGTPNAWSWSICHCNQSQYVKFTIPHSYENHYNANLYHTTDTETDNRLYTVFLSVCNTVKALRIYAVLSTVSDKTTESIQKNETMFKMSVHMFQ